MEVTQDLSFVHLISHASVLVQLVMGLLLVVSLMSWWYISVSYTHLDVYKRQHLSCTAVQHQVPEAATY